MGSVRITKGILAGLELQEKTPQEIVAFAASGEPELKRISFFGQRLSRVTFRNVSFVESGFARTLLGGRAARFRRTSW